METIIYYLIEKVYGKVNIKKLVFTENDEEFDGEGLEDFKEYVDECIDDEIGNIEQHGGSCIVLTLSDLYV